MTDFAFDTETHRISKGDELICTCGRFHGLVPPIVVGSFATSKDTYAQFAPHLPTSGVWERLQASAARGGSIYVANGAYDFGCIATEIPEALSTIWQWYEEGRVHDVLVACTLNAIAEGRLHDGELFMRNGSPAIDPEKGTRTTRYSLALAAKEWLGREDAKRNDAYRLRYAELESVPMQFWPHEAQQYPLDDARTTYDVASQQLDPFHERPCENLHEVAKQSHTWFCLHLGAVVGFKTDPERVGPLKNRLEDELNKRRERAREMGFMRLETKKGVAKYVKNTKVIKARVEEAYGVYTPKTDTKQTSADRVTLEESADDGLMEFAEISKTEKLAGYVPVLESGTKYPVSVRPNVLLSTGRASYEGVIQLMPRKGGIRECIKFRGVGSSVDYSAVELSTLAQVCIWTVGYSDLAEAINKGLDPHALLGSKLANVSYKEFVQRLEAKDAATKDLRQAAKAGNFGFPGMMGAPKFVIAKRKEGSRVCEWFYRDGRCGERKIHEWYGKPLERRLCERCCETAAILKSEYLQMWREVKPYWGYVSAQVDTKGGLEQFISKRFRGLDRAPAAANTLFQGLAADGAKAAVRKLTKEMYLERSSPLFGTRLMAFAHDETLVDIPDEGVDFVYAAARRQATVMVEEMKAYVPDVLIKAEPALMRYWYKEADPVRDAQGRLIPWEPKKEAA